MNKTPKIDRKTLKAPDEFMLKGQRALAALQGYQNRFVPIVVVAIVVVAAVYGYDWWVGRRLQGAWKEYYEITKLGEDARIEKYKAFHSSYGSIRPGVFAAVAVADKNLEKAREEVLKEGGGSPNGPATVALEWYGKALEYRDLLPLEKQLIYVDKGNALEILGKVDDALKEYQAASEITGEARPIALLNLGRAWEMKSDIARATQVYDRLTSEFPNTEFSRQAKNYVRRLKSPLFTVKDAG